MLFFLFYPITLFFLIFAAVNFAMSTFWFNTIHFPHVGLMNGLSYLLPYIKDLFWSKMTYSQGNAIQTKHRVDTIF